MSSHLDSCTNRSNSIRGAITFISQVRNLRWKSFLAQVHEYLRSNLMFCSLTYITYKFNWKSLLSVIVLKLFLTVSLIGLLRTWWRRFVRWFSTIVASPQLSTEEDLKRIIGFRVGSLWARIPYSSRSPKVKGLRLVHDVQWVRVFNCELLFCLTFILVVLQFIQFPLVVGLWPITGAHH